MISKEELRVWLEDESYRPLIDDSPRHGTQVFIKVPKDEEFIYLYRQYCYDKEDVVRRREDFEDSGIYSKIEGKIYFAHGYFEDIDPEIEVKTYTKQMKENITKGVCAKVEAWVNNDVANLDVARLLGSDSKDLEYYRNYGVINDGRRFFLEGRTPEEITYQCGYSFDEWKRDTELLSYLRNPSAFIEKEAQEYFAKHQERILLALNKNEVLKAELQGIENLKDTSLRRLRDVMTAARSTDAKTLSVTAHKEGKTLTFKIDANALRRDPGTYYSDWDMPAKDRHEFERTFGERNQLYPEDIVDISYFGKSIYSAEPYEEPVETEEMQQTM